MREMTNGRLWGPTHQHMEPPFPFRKAHPVASCFGGLLALFVLFFLVGVVRLMLGLGSGDPIGWTIGAVIVLVAARVLLTLGVALFTRTPRTHARPAPLEPVADRPAAGRPVSPAAGRSATGSSGAG